MAKSLYITYLLWMTGGLFGLHHLYLGRDYQWLLWFTSWGVFFVGYLTDLCKIPSYVGQANHNLQYMERFNTFRGSKVREFQPARLIGAYIFSSYYELVFVYAIDCVIPLLCQLVFKSIGRALGIYLCFSIGEKRTSLRYILVASFLSEMVVRLLYIIIFPRKTLPAIYGKTDMAMLLGFIPFCITGAAAYATQRYREHIVRRHPCCRLPFFVVSAVVWLLLLSSALYHHLDIPTPHDPQNATSLPATGNKKLKDVVSDFVNSDAYRKIKLSVAIFREGARNDGMLVAWSNLLQSFSNIQSGENVDQKTSNPLTDASLFDKRRVVFEALFSPDSQICNQSPKSLSLDEQGVAIVTT